MNTSVQGGRHPAAAGILARFTPVVTWRAEDFDSVALEHVQWFAREFPHLEETRRLTRAESDKLDEIQAEIIARMEAGDMAGFRKQLDRAKRAWKLMLGSETPLGGEFTAEDLEWNAGIPARRAAREAAERRAAEFDRGWAELQAEMARVRETEERAEREKAERGSAGEPAEGGAPSPARAKTSAKTPAGNSSRASAGRLFDLPTPDPTGESGPFAGSAAARGIKGGGKAQGTAAGAQAAQNGEADRNGEAAASGADRPPTPSPGAIKTQAQESPQATTQSTQAPDTSARLKNYAEEI